MKPFSHLSRKVSLTVLATLLSVASLHGQVKAQRPSLVVNILVRGLSSETLQMLQPLLSDGGLRKLATQGVVIDQTYYGPHVDDIAATTMLLTGAAPSVNGITSATIYDPSTRQSTPALHDPAYMGNFTTQTYSPAPLRVSTVADELAVASGGASRIYSVAADPQLAILGAGHSADGAFWIYDNTGNWASTTYYKEMPSVVTNANYRKPISSRLDTLRWQPLFPATYYYPMFAGESNKTFRHTFPAKDADRYHNFMHSAPANTFITDMAIELIADQRMGRRNVTDMITLGYDLTPLSGETLESADMYMRLDRDIARLLAATASLTPEPLVILSALPATPYNRLDDKKYRIPTGQFSIKRAISLLNMYLIALHGNGDWITGFDNNQFYLNRKLITDRDLNLAAFRSEVAEFLARMSGVTNVYTIDDILAARVGDDPVALKRNISPNHFGDVVIEINPGWEITDSDERATSHVVRLAPTLLPTYIMVPQLKPRHIAEPVDARAIASTLSRLLMQRYPNASTTPPITIAQ